MPVTDWKQYIDYGGLQKIKAVPMPVGDSGTQEKPLLGCNLHHGTFLWK